MESIVAEPSENAIRTLIVYRHGSMWVFNDERHGIVQEPFVAGIDDMIDKLVAEIPYAALGFNLIFSTHKFPGSTITLKRGLPDDGGVWYNCVELGLRGWLCPALFKYFREPPGTLYIAARGISHRSTEEGR